MNVAQVYNLVNTAATETLGTSAVINEDLSNLVDLGKSFENAQGLDNFVRSLCDHIGKVIFDERVYTGRAPSVLMDGWEYGSILEKIRADLPDAMENESWELVDGASYDPNVFHKPRVSAKFFNNRTTFEVDASITRRQVKSAFSSAMQMNGLLSLIRTRVEHKMTMSLDQLIMRTINTMTAETLYNEYSGGNYSASSGTRAVNLLYLYNQTVPAGSALTAAAAILDPAFIRFASYNIKMYMRRMQEMSKLFNVGGTVKFTPRDRMHIVMLDEFATAAEVYLYDARGQFSTENIRLPERMETVSYWQGSGTGYAFSSTSAINVKTPDNHTVNAGGILGVIFDRDALGVANLDRSTEIEYNKKAQFWNEFHKMEAGYFGDLDENFVVFFVA